jgi:uncharacterized protein
MGFTMENDVTELLVNPSIVRRIFVGNKGIRAGWSIGIFFILMSLLTAAFFFPAKFILEKNGLPFAEQQPLQICVIDFACFLGLLGASMIMALIEHKPIISYGLEGTRRFAKLFYGALSGVIALSVLVYVLKIGGFLIFDGQPVLNWQVIQYAFSWGITFFLVGLYEEYFSRGYMQATLTRGIGFWWSALVLSLAFGCLHISNKGESPIGIFSAALDGMICCISLWYLKDLWWAIGFHASWDWAESYLWGTANSGRVVQGHLFSVHPQGNVLWSGGATGPEGSILVIPLLLFIGLLMWIIWKRTNVPLSKSVGTAIPLSD